MSSGFDTDVFVVGGGPAGLATAIAARQKGLDVTIADAARPPIDKACGEGLMPDSLRALDLLGVSLDGQPAGVFRGIRFISPRDTVDSYFPNGIGLGIRRTLLHQLLVQRAERLGVRFLWNTPFRRLQGSAVQFDGGAARARWIIGADGQNSQLRKAAGLDASKVWNRRIGLRRHFAVPHWSDFVEIYWAGGAQAYITAVAPREMCVAIISQKKLPSFEHGLALFPQLAERLSGVPATDAPRGAPTVSRRLKAVFRDHVALIGEASGSVDAITGEGLAIAFRQAIALADALSRGDLALYGEAHRRIAALPDFMARTMLLMDKSALLRRRALSVLAKKPALFEQLLSVHVGHSPLRYFGRGSMSDVAWQLLTA